MTTFKCPANKNPDATNNIEELKRYVCVIDLCVKYCLTIFLHQVFWLWKFGTEEYQDRHVQHVEKDTYLARM